MLYLIGGALLLIYSLLVLLTLMPRAAQPVRDLAGPQARFIKINGHTIHYIQQGQGQPVVLVHGFGGWTYTWRKLIPLLAENNTVYALDLLGFGLSDKPAGGPYDFASQARLVVDFMEAMQLRSATLAGHSMGSVVAAQTAARYPEKIDNLVIITGIFHGGGRPDVLKVLPYPFDRLLARAFYTRTLQKKTLAIGYHDKTLVTPEVVDAYLRPGRTPQALASFAALVTGDALDIPPGISSQIRVPTCIIWGADDKATPLASGHALHREIAGSRFVTIPDCGHFVPEEQPEKLAAAVLRFIGRD